MEDALSLGFIGLDKLISIFVDGEVSDVAQLLEYRLTLLQRWLETPAARELVNNFPDQIESLMSHQSSSVVRYSLAIVVLLECLAECLRHLRNQFESASSPRESRPLSSAALPPPLFPGTLSCRQRRTVQSAIQHVLSLSVLPCLPSGVGVSLEQRSEQAARIRRLVSAATGTLISRRSHALLCVDRLLIWAVSFDRDQLRDLLLSDSVLPDIFALLALVAHGPNPRRKNTDGQSGSTHLSNNNISENSDIATEDKQELPSRSKPPSSLYRDCISEDMKCADFIQVHQQRVYAAELLDRLTTDINSGGSQMVMARAILLLQRCAQQNKPVRRWMCSWCWRCIYDLISVSGGLSLVTGALLHFWGQDRVDHIPPTHIQTAAKLLVSLPPDGHRLAYYTHLSREVLRLLRLPRVELRVSCVRVAASIIQALCSSPAVNLDESSNHDQTSPSTDTVRRMVDREVVRPLISCLLDSHTHFRWLDGVTDGVESSRSVADGVESSHSVADGVECADSVADGVECADSVADGVECAHSVADGVECLSQLFVCGMEPQDHAALHLLDAYSGALLLLYTRWRRRRVFASTSCLLQLLARVTSCYSASECCERVLLAVASDDRVYWDRGDDDGGCGEMPAGAWVSVGEVAAAFADVVALACRDDVALLADVLIRLCQLMRCGEDQSADLPHSTHSSSDPYFKQLEEREFVMRRALLCVHSVAALSELDSIVDRIVDGATVGDSQLTDRLLPALVCLISPTDAACVAAEHPLARQSVISALALTGVLLTSVAAAEESVSGSSTAPVWSRARQLLLPALRDLMETTGEDRRLRETAQCVYQLVITNGVVDRSSHRSPESSQSEFERVMYQLDDPLVPVRGHAVIRLSQLLRERDPVTWQNRHSLLSVFQERLCEEDSYVYLAAVRGLSYLADLCTEQVIDPLCSHYVSKERDSDTRLKLGECLIYMVSQLGDVVPKYANRLLNAFLGGCRDSDDAIRCSSLCNLSELCRLLRYSLSSSINEVLLCVYSLLDTDDSVQVRRAAVLFISQLLSGLDNHIFTVLRDDLTPLYRRVKLLLQRETDSALLRHANSALNTINNATSRSLSQPARQPLQKHIRVIDWPQ